ncbi:polymeric immunoglobulin receptor isoform X2 [Scleropages formosus]|uniref:Polymeric immunoglobulin receptor n=1 Tax=Scleropages formosus TaxID=113540 RepID=A0A8C9WAG7_SCLFO|nr:CMRF35-like molecule 1 isoform X2 [Scleropages formosus]
MSPAFLLRLLFLVFGFPGVLGAVSTLKDLTILEGHSVTVPCHYEPQYADHVKYWCRGNLKDFCKSVARTDSTPVDSRVEIHDDPTQMVFSITMKELRAEDSAWYWCGVEIGGIWTADDTASVHISVVHGVSVVNQMVTGEEGGSVSVQCFYSDGHRTSVKKWCRSADWNTCVTLGVNGTMKEDSVVISDDHNRAFTVTLLHLGKKDTGWYRCAAGHQHATVHIEVLPRSLTELTPTTLQTTSLQALDLGHVTRQLDTGAGQDDWVSPLLICGILSILVLVVMVTWRLWGQKPWEMRRRVLEIETDIMKDPEYMKDKDKFGTVFFNSSSQRLQMD